jgi:transposase
MIKKGSWITTDNGGAAGDILDSIVESGNKYLTRVKMNVSDDIRMIENANKWEYTEEGVCCIRHTFTSSGRTSYLFFSADGWKRSYDAAERRVVRMTESARSYDSGRFKISDFVTVKKNAATDIDVKVTVQTHFDYDDPGKREHMIMGEMKNRSGIFKLESSDQLTPSEALNKYCGRSSVEHLIHSLKRVTGLKPLRVRKKTSIHGSMMPAMLSEMAMAMARYEPDAEIVTKMR